MVVRQYFVLALVSFVVLVSIIQAESAFVFERDHNEKILPDFGTRWFDKPKPKRPRGPPVGKPFLPDKRSPYKVFDSDVGLNSFDDNTESSTHDVNAKTRSSEIDDPRLTQTINGDTYYGLNSPNDRSRLKEAAMNYDQNDAHVRSAKGLPMSSNEFPTMEHIEEETHVVEQPLQHTASISHQLNQNIDDHMHTDEQARTKHNVDEQVTVNEVQGPYEQNMDGSDLRYDNDLTAKLIDHIKSSDKPPLGELEGITSKGFTDPHHTDDEHSDDVQPTDSQPSDDVADASHVEDNQLTDSHHTEEAPPLPAPGLSNEPLTHKQEQPEQSEAVSKLVENIKEEDKPPVVHMSEEDMKSNPDKHLHDSPGIPELDAISSENEALHLGSHFGDSFPQEPEDDTKKEEHKTHIQHHSRMHKSHRYLPSHGGTLSEILSAENEGQKHHSHGKKDNGHHHMTIDTNTGEIVNEFKISSKAIKAEDPLTRSDANKAEKYNHPLSTKTKNISAGEIKKFKQEHHRRVEQESSPHSRQILHQPPIHFPHGFSGIHRYGHDSSEHDSNEHEEEPSKIEELDDESLRVLNKHKKPESEHLEQSTNYDPYPPNWEEEMMGHGEAESRHKTDYDTRSHKDGHGRMNGDHERVISEISEIISGSDDISHKAMPEMEDSQEDEEHDEEHDEEPIHHEIHQHKNIHHEHHDSQNDHGGNHHMEHEGGHAMEHEGGHTMGHGGDRTMGHEGSHSMGHEGGHTMGHEGGHTMRHEGGHTMGREGSHSMVHEGGHTMGHERGHTTEHGGSHSMGREGGHSVNQAGENEEHSDREDEEENVKNVHPSYASQKYDTDIDTAMGDQQHRSHRHHEGDQHQNAGGNHHHEGDDGDNHHSYHSPSDTTDDHIHEDESYANNDFDGGGEDGGEDEENSKKKSTKALHKKKHKYPHEPRIVKQHELIEPSFMLHEDPHGDGLGNGLVAGLELGVNTEGNVKLDNSQSKTKDPVKREKSNSTLNNFTNTESSKVQDGKSVESEMDNSKLLVTGKIKARILPNKIISNIGNSQDEVNVEIDSNAIQNMIKSSLIGLTKENELGKNKHESYEKSTESLTNEVKEKVNKHSKEENEPAKEVKPSDWSKAAESENLKMDVKKAKEKIEATDTAPSHLSFHQPSLSENTKEMVNSKDVSAEQRHITVDSQEAVQKNKALQSHTEHVLESISNEGFIAKSNPDALRLLTKATTAEEKLAKMDNDVTEQLNKASKSLAKATESRYIKQPEVDRDNSVSKDELSEADGPSSRHSENSKMNQNLNVNQHETLPNRDTQDLKKESSENENHFSKLDKNAEHNNKDEDQSTKPLVKTKLLSKIEEHLNGFEIEDLSAIHDQLKQLHAQKMLEKSQDKNEKTEKKSVDSHLDLDVKSTKYDIPDHQLTLPITNPGHPDDSNGVPESLTRGRSQLAPLLNPSPTSPPIAKVEALSTAREALSYQKQPLKTEKALTKNSIYKKPSSNLVKVTGKETELDLQPFVVASKTKALFLKHLYPDVNGVTRGNIAGKNKLINLNSRLKKYRINIPTLKPDIGPINYKIYKNFTTHEKVDQVSDLGDIPDEDMSKHILNRRNIKRPSIYRRRTTMTSRRSIVSPIKNSNSYKNIRYDRMPFDEFNARQHFIRELVENLDKAKDRRRVLSVKRSLG